MLRIVAKTISGTEIPLESVISLVLSMDEGVPCDSLNLVVQGSFREEFCEISAYDGAVLVYRGIVDEQILQFSEEEKTQIVSRSIAALSVDNEAYPETFNFPDTELIFSRYLKPLGFVRYVGKNKAFGGKFRVTKGMSSYQVAEKFAKAVYGASPVMSEDSVIFEMEETEPVRFTENPYGQGVFFDRMESALRRYYPISHVWVKTHSFGGYDTLICDEEAVKRGIRRERYLNASVPSEVSLSKADEIISSAKQKLSAVTLWCPTGIYDILGRKAELNCETFEKSRGYRVSSLRYSQKNDQEETRVILRREG